MSTAARFMPVLVNVLLNLGFFGKLSFLDAETALKASAVWMGLNGAFGYLSTDKWLDGWGGSVFTAANVFMGKSVLESFGAMMIVYLIGSLDGLYVSKTMESMGVEANKGLFW